MSVWCWFGGKYVDYSAKNFFARFGVEPEKLLKVFDEARDRPGERAGLARGPLGRAWSAPSS